VYDRLVELGLPVTAYNGGEAPYETERLVNARAEDYCNLREIFGAGRRTSTSLTTSLLRNWGRSSGR
jgi:hypothetical protein